MRKTILNKEWLFNSRNEFCGVNLGSDFCAEHEHGIDLLRAAFNIDSVVKKKVSRLFGVPIRTTLEPNFGISSRMINCKPEGFINGTAANLRFIGYYDTVFSKWVNTLVRDAAKTLRIENNKIRFVAYWCDRGFLIVSSDQQKMIALRDAFRENDIAIYLGGRGLLSNPGLNLVISTKLDQAVMDRMKESDEAAYELAVAVEKSGIEKKLNDAGKHYFVLSPRWNEDKTAIRFWLNPQEQDKYNYGWYGIEELEQWIKNEGPIIIKQEDGSKENN